MDRQPVGWTGYEGPCPNCGTDHGGFPLGSGDGDLRCRIAQAEATAEDHIIDQVRAMEAHWHHERDQGLRAQGRDPDEARERGFLPPKRWELPPEFYDRAPHRK